MLQVQLFSSKDEEKLHLQINHWLKNNKVEKIEFAKHLVHESEKSLGATHFAWIYYSLPDPKN